MGVAIRLTGLRCFGSELTSDLIDRATSSLHYKPPEAHVSRFGFSCSTEAPTEAPEALVAKCTTRNISVLVIFPII